MEESGVDTSRDTVIYVPNSELKLAIKLRDMSSRLLQARKESAALWNEKLSARVREAEAELQGSNSEMIKSFVRLFGKSEHEAKAIFETHEYDELENELRLIKE